jgi:hypothetical protein
MDESLTPKIRPLASGDESLALKIHPQRINIRSQTIKIDSQRLKIHPQRLKIRSQRLKIQSLTVKIESLKAVFTFHTATTAIYCGASSLFVAEAHNHLLTSYSNQTGENYAD